MDFWLEVCLFGLILFVNKESGIYNGFFVVSNILLVWNYELYSDLFIKLVNVFFILIFFVYRSL